MARVVEVKIVIPLKSKLIGEVSNIDKVLLDIEDVLVERLGVAVDLTSEITRKLPPRKVERPGSIGVAAIILPPAKPYSDRH